MTAKEATKRLKEIYPTQNFKSKDERLPWCLITKERQFLAWVQDGNVDTTLIPELVNDKQ
jgi:hypothetical protein